jgi:hypothetical protein
MPGESEANAFDHILNDAGVIKKLIYSCLRESYHGFGVIKVS